jgi:CDGSH-type Zn-finger protein
MKSSDDSKRPVIEPSPDGPYILTNLTALKNSKGSELPAKPVMALCRCGGSSDKPFCDGTHAKIGFSGARQTDGSANKQDRYEGRRITINDNRSVCAHSGMCTDNLKSVFKLGAEPWIDPDGAGAEAIIETVRKCPSGALSYSIGGVEYAGQDREPMVTVTKDGPYSVVGGIELRDKVTTQQPQSREHCTLCRCGGSRNKPFCDGTHWHIKFRDDKN